MRKRLDTLTPAEYNRSKSKRPLQLTTSATGIRSTRCGGAITWTTPATIWEVSAIMLVARLERVSKADKNVACR